LLFGPADFAAQIVFQLSLGIGLARLSHVRAVAMVLLGLLLSTVGVDVSSGAERLTMGLEQLSDGIAFSSLVLGLMVVADSAICVVSPTLLLETYAVRLAGWAAPRVPVVAGILMRAAAVLAIAAACYAVFALNRSLWDVGQLAVFGAVGIACKLLGWNRPLIFLSFLLGHLLEENISRALLISRGDPATFARPLSAAFLLLACLVVVAAAVLSARARAREPIL
jgi:TctA family transporter